MLINHGRQTVLSCLHHGLSLKPHYVYQCSHGAYHTEYIKFIHIHFLSMRAVVISSALKPDLRF
jgi:hypothetical protein